MIISNPFTTIYIIAAATWTNSQRIINFAPPTKTSDFLHIIMGFPLNHSLLRATNNDHGDTGAPTTLRIIQTSLSSRPTRTQRKGINPPDNRPSCGPAENWINYRPSLGRFVAKTTGSDNQILCYDYAVVSKCNYGQCVSITGFWSDFMNPWGTSCLDSGRDERKLHCNDTQLF